MYDYSIHSTVRLHFDSAYLDIDMQEEKQEFKPYLHLQVISNTMLVAKTELNI